jgi:phosphoglycolate phosphatase
MTQTFALLASFYKHSPPDGTFLQALQESGTCQSPRIRRQSETELVILTHQAFREEEFHDYPPGPMLPGLDIEVRNPEMPRGRMRFALFDFDGTISLVRAGWQDVMIPMLVEKLAELHTGETEQQLYRLVKDFVVTLTGKQTIYQMIRLAEEIRKRGGTPRDPLVYKREYIERLWQRIEGRVKALQDSTCRPEQMRVPGSLELLQELSDRGIALYLASGTDIEYVRSEAELVGVAHFFEPHIYGALDRHQDFSKQMVIERIITDNNLHGPELCAFGDGYVEILNVKQAGGIAVGAATDEYKRYGVNRWKRNRLAQAGADVIVPDFRRWRPLVAYLMAEDNR